MKYKFNLKKTMSKMMIIAFCGTTIAEHSYINQVNAIERELVKNTAVDTWISGATSMSIGRGELTTELVEKKIYSIGGHLNFNYSNIVEVYDLETDTWDSGTNMPTRRGNLASSSVDGNIYCIGGKDLNTFLNTVEVYNPKTDSWTTVTNMPTERAYLTSAVVDGKIYCIGGYNGSYLNTVEVYDPKTNRWETKRSMPTARDGLLSAVIDGKIYCIGGNSNSNVYSVEVYDPKTDTWETKKPMPTNKYNFSGGIVNDKIYCIGGYNGSYLNTVEVYDPKTDTWESKQNMPIPRYDFSAEATDGKIYCIGGYDDYYNTLDVVDVYIAERSTPTPEEEAEHAVGKAEQTRDPIDIENAKDLVNQLPESDKKNELLDRLDRLTPKSITSNIDVYIKPESVLSLSVNTNSVTFEDFDGTEDMEMQNAITLTVESTLPYEINSSLETEIQNSTGTEILDKSLLNIKANEKSNYNTFSAIKTPIVLLDVQDIDSINNHGIDLRLNKAIVPNIDVYKTTIKFEIKQK